MSSTSAIWVTHPSTGLEIDVAPLFAVFEELDAPVGAAISDGATNAVRRAIRSINLSIHDPNVMTPVQLANLYRDLHRIEDAFGGMKSRAVTTTD